ncbi:hypothetical protein [Pseudolysinimonas sp.]|uniref:hypothetical protein n=1 Tax=Pseudolysinimonas sp. TaxID=2680009 RepID=UPI003F7FB598
MLPVRPVRLAVAVSLFGGALAAAAGAGFGIYALNRNALYVCTGTLSPQGARPHEAGYAGSGAMVFPVAGTRCDWNGIDGTVFSTVDGQPVTTALVWTAVALAVAGAAVLVVRAIRHRWRMSSPGR